MRVGAVDIGTNSTRLLVADVEGGRVTEIARHVRITRLGEGVDEEPVLRDGAMNRVFGVLQEYAGEAKRHGATRVLAAATSAVRDARNGASFLAEIESRLGFATRLLSGAEEATTTYRGVRSDGPVADGTLILDIGGGSTELTTAGPTGIAYSSSLPLGCVRLTERFLLTDPPGRDELAACGGHARSLLPPLTPSAAIGVAGTITTLASLDLDLDRYEPTRIHGHTLTAPAIARTLTLLAEVALSERERILHLEPARAPVIVAGAAILSAVMETYGLAEIQVSERDILHGIALAAADLR